MNQEEFTSLAIFVAVVDELRHEPFFSEDNHVGLGSFCHPMFLKSAVLPFRKIWMERERCAFRKRNGTGGIRDLVFKEHSNKALVSGHRYWFYYNFEQKLTESPGLGWTRETSKAIIDLWLNTQLAHSGPKDYKKKQPWERDLAEFNALDAKIGRRKFEYSFRSAVYTIGFSYISFAKLLAIPLYNELRDKKGMVPTFEADIALKYNPYPHPKYKIQFHCRPITTDAATIMCGFS